MVHNRNKLIDLFIGNTANVVVHKILEKAIEDEDIGKKYIKEIRNSHDIAKKYRKKINPADNVLNDKKAEEIKNKIIIKVQSEISIRIAKGYKNIDINLIDKITYNTLKEFKII